MKYIVSLLISLILSGCSMQKSNIQTIEYEAGACFGYCPMFKMVINSDRTAAIEAERFTFSKPENRDWNTENPEGTFTATIKEAQFNRLNKLINDANLKSLKDFYGNKNVTDLPTSHLTVTYSDGSKKHIEDYGKDGTDALHEIYTALEDLRENQSWVRIK